MSLGEGSSGASDSTEEHHQAKCRRAAAERTKFLEQGLAMTGKECRLVDAGAHGKLLREVDLPNLDHSPWEIDIQVTVNG